MLFRSEWLAWEWGADVILAAAHSAAGLKGVALLGGALIAATLALLFQFLLWQGVDAVVALLVALVAGSASTIHWLARPHLFTWLLLLVSLWLLESERRGPGGRVWLLAPLAALWANLHGGFALLPGVLSIYAAGSTLETLLGPRPWRWAGPARYAAVTVAAGLATLVNPYGWRLHAHIWAYLGSSFIRDRVEEFQSPRFRGESMAAFEVLLLAGLVAVGWLWRRRELSAALLVLALAHLALASARHVPLYVTAAAPVVGRMATAALGNWGGC